jgi:hypothetical protein
MSETKLVVNQHVSECRGYLLRPISHSLPLAVLGKNANHYPAVQGKNSAGGAGVEGDSVSGTGVIGLSTATDDYGVSGSGNTVVYGYSLSESGYGVWGVNDHTVGVLGSSNHIGVSGFVSGDVTSGGAGQARLKSQTGWRRGSVQQCFCVGCAPQKLFFVRLYWPVRKEVAQKTESNIKR